MSLTAGARLGPYEILSPLGAGGDRLRFALEPFATIGVSCGCLREHLDRDAAI